MKGLTFKLIAALLLCATAHGQVMNDPSAAKRNAKWLRESVWAGNVTLPVGIVYVDMDKQPAVTQPTPGCLRIKTEGSISYPETSGGNVSTIVQLGKGPVFRLAGYGAYCVEPFTLCGDGESAAIEVEGRANPASGGHDLRHIAFYNWGVGIKTLAGYYKNGQFVPDESHADQTDVTRCRFFKVGTVFQSENQQSNGWNFMRCSVDVLDNKSVTLADLKRSSNVTFEGTMINHPRVTIFKLRDYSPNNCTLICRDLFMDLPTTTDAWFVPVEHTGPDHYKDCKWKIEISGSVPESVVKRYKVPDSLPREKWSIRL